MREFIKITILCFLVSIDSIAISSEPEGKQAYENAFHKNALRILKAMSAGGSTPEATIDSQSARVTVCHMGALEYYSPGLQKVAYDTILNGGSYADAKMAFDEALAIEGSTGGERFDKIQEMYLNAEAFGKECLGFQQ